MQWAGVPDTIYSDTGGDNDYNDDLRGRGYWVNYLCGGSKILPDSIGLHIPIDAALAFHSDAGNEPGDSIVGSMGIYYTGRGKKERYYANGTRRTQSQKLAQCILGKISQDIGGIEPRWTMREDRNKRYAEARIGEVPTLLLETMSHQNFTDMVYGHDPNAKFVIARAIYKAVLKYIHYAHGEKHYSVQPLPVRHFSATLTDDGRGVRLAWEPTPDPSAPDAAPTGYIVYTRAGDGSFDNGIYIKEKTSVVVPVEPGVLYSFRVAAVNRGGALSDGLVHGLVQLAVEGSLPLKTLHFLAERNHIGFHLVISSRVLGGKHSIRATLAVQERLGRVPCLGALFAQGKNLVHSCFLRFRRPRIAGL